jgi:trk system potassium uptake protein TrkH
VLLTIRTPNWQRQADRFEHPARVIAGGFGVAIAIGTALLSLPFATESGSRADLVDALFTATSAVCLTGLVTVDVGSYWSGYGETVILLLIQAGGLGIMTLATLFTIVVFRRLGLRARHLLQDEAKTNALYHIRALLPRIVTFSLATELAVAIVLTVRFAVTYDEPFGTAAYHGVFHAVSAFNNAGFSVYQDNLVRYVTDPWVSLTISGAAILGGLGFPVVLELARAWRRPSEWSVMTRLTVGFTVILLAGGTCVYLAAEFTNEDTLGRLDGGSMVLAAFFASAMTRTAGFTSIDVGALRPESLLASDVLMFVGGGSGGTAGGIKVTTFGLLGYVIWAEMRGETRVNVGRREVPAANQRQALAIALLAVGAVAVSTLVLLSVTRHSLDRVLFEAVSAFGTVGLSTGITAGLSVPAHLVLVALMFIGRIGPLAVFAALALRERTRVYELPEERTIVG